MAAHEVRQDVANAGTAPVPGYCMICLSLYFYCNTASERDAPAFSRTHRCSSNSTTTASKCEQPASSRNALASRCRSSVSLKRTHPPPLLIWFWPFFREPLSRMAAQRQSEFTASCTATVTATTSFAISDSTAARQPQNQ